jgi:hypothetical protein
MSELATKTIILHATSRKLRDKPEDKSILSVLDDVIEDMIKIQRRLQLEINQ